MNEVNYIIGLNLDIASVGWAVVGIDGQEIPTKLIDCGVRVFDRAEVPKTGESLAASRRLARSSRRLVRRRAHRLQRLRRLLKRQGVLNPECFDERGYIKQLPVHAWQLRVEGLDRRLSSLEWAAVLHHIIKHRGYLSQRKSERLETGNETGNLLKSVIKNSEILKSGQYRTPAEMALNCFIKEDGHIRNQDGNYAHTFDRHDLVSELKLLFEKQRFLANPNADTSLESAILSLLMCQRSILSGEAVLRMHGKCPFEVYEYKAPKATYCAERFEWLIKLNRLCITDMGEERSLTKAEQQLLINEPYKKNRLTYSQIRKLLNLPKTAIFKGLHYYGRGEGSLVKAENAIFVELKAYHAFRKALQQNGLGDYWQKISRDIPILDEIGAVFALYKTDAEIHQALLGKISEDAIDILLEKINFAAFCPLSLTAMYKLMSLMEQGISYKKACQQVYGHSHELKAQQTTPYLPVFPENKFHNPVVLRSLSQTRKVINAIIGKYGAPHSIHIGMEHRFNKNFTERKELEKIQKSHVLEKGESVKQFKKTFPHFPSLPKGRELLKFRLYVQQNGLCLYSGEPININKLFDPDYVELDYALPFTRTWDDSLDNKILVLVQSMQTKCHLTPYEWLDGQNNSAQWRVFESVVKGSYFSFKKQQRILTHELNETFWLERNISETNYIAHFLQKFIEDNLEIKGLGNKSDNKRVWIYNRQIISFLKGRWHLTKMVNENNRHYAQSAIISACFSRGMQKRILTYMNGRETRFTITEGSEPKVQNSLIHFPRPWKSFSEEIAIRVFDSTPLQTLGKECAEKYEKVGEGITPLFVSRAPNRKGKGRAHQETIKSAKRLSEGISVSKLSLTQLKLADLERMVNKCREPALYQALYLRLIEHEDNPISAFSEPFYKEGKNGSRQLVKSVRVENIQKSGVLVRGGTGVADNATMIRIDIFEKGGKHYLVPVYAWQIEKGTRPNKAVVAHKEERYWTEMTESFEFLFSLYPNDLVEVLTKKEYLLGYYIGFDRASGSINIREHDMDKHKVKDGVNRGVGVKNALLFNKLQVDVLGKQINLVRHEKRPIT